MYLQKKNLKKLTKNLYEIFDGLYYDSRFPFLLDLDYFISWFRWRLGFLTGNYFVHLNILFIKLTAAVPAKKKDVYTCWDGFRFKAG